MTLDRGPPLSEPAGFVVLNPHTQHTALLRIWPKREDTLGLHLESWLLHSLPGGLEKVTSLLVPQHPHGSNREETMPSS